MTTKAKLFIGITATIGFIDLAISLWHWHSDDLVRFSCYIGIALLASGLKVELPGIDGTMSVNFLFILLGVLELSFPETLIIGCSATLLQCVWRTRKRVSPAKVLFNVLSATAITLSYVTYHNLASAWGGRYSVLLLGLSAIVYFVANCVTSNRGAELHAMLPWSTDGQDLTGPTHRPRMREVANRMIPSRYWQYLQK